LIISLEASRLVRYVSRSAPTPILDTDIRLTQTELAA
jgi:hypothetical protein